MAELILRGKAGPPAVRRENTSIIIKKTIAGERERNDRDLHQRRTSGKHEVHERICKHSRVKRGYCRRPRGETAGSENAKDMKAAVRKIAFLTNKLVSEKEDGKANTTAWTRRRGELREATKELKAQAEKATEKQEKKQERKDKREEATKNEGTAIFHKCERNLKTKQHF